MTAMVPVLLAACAGTGVTLLATSRPRARSLGRQVRRTVDPGLWLRQAGLAETDPREFAVVVGTLGLLGGAITFAVFGGMAPAILVGGFAASFPVASYRKRRNTRMTEAQEAWPRLIEEIRVRTSAIGRSIPQALFEVGTAGPPPMQPAFRSAHREWLLTTDMQRAVAVLKEQLGDPTADMALETLLVAHELGGSDLDRRLEALAEDRRQDVQGRKDARSRQAGARFARVFVLLVPAGMAAAGMSIGDGRAAFRTTTGQAVAAVAITLVIACWAWAGHVMRLPTPERVFDR